MKILLPTILLSMIALDVELVLAVRRVWAKESSLEEDMDKIKEKFPDDFSK